MGNCSSMTFRGHRNLASVPASELRVMQASPSHSQSQAEAASRINEWVQRNDPHAELDLSSLGLRGLSVALPPGLTRLNLSGNPLEELPHNWLELPPTCTITLDTNHLTAEQRQQLDAHMLANSTINLFSENRRQPVAVGPRIRIEYPSMTEELTQWRDAGGDARENRAQAVERIQSWIEGRNPLASLDLRNLGLMTMPPLPNTLRDLDISGNRLTVLDELPDSLLRLSANNNQLTALAVSPNLTYLGANRNQLSRLDFLSESPVSLNLGHNTFGALPARQSALRYLDVSHNQLRNLPELPSSLESLVVAVNPLTRLPALPRQLTSLDFSGCDLTEEPRGLPSTLHYYDSIGTLHNFPTQAPLWADLPANHRSDYMAALQAITQAAPQTAPQTAAQAALRTATWNGFREEENAGAFDQFLNRLPQTAIYQNAALRPELTQRVHALLDQLQQDSALRALCFHFAADALTHCGDRVAMVLLNMEMLARNQRMETAIQAGAYDVNPQKLIDEIRENFRSEVIAVAAANKIHADPGADEMSVHLGLIAALRAEFQLASHIQALQFQILGHITPQDIQQVREQLTRKPFDDQARALYRTFFANGNQGEVDALERLPNYSTPRAQVPDPDAAFLSYLANSPAMQAMLNRAKAPAMAAVRREVDSKIVAEKDRLHSAVLDLHARAQQVDVPDFVEQNNALMREFDSVTERITKPMVAGLLTDFLRKENLDAALEPV